MISFGTVASGFLTIAFGPFFLDGLIYVIVLWLLVPWGLYFLSRSSGSSITGVWIFLLLVPYSWLDVSVSYIWNSSKFYYSGIMLECYELLKCSWFYFLGLFYFFGVINKGLKSSWSSNKFFLTDDKVLKEG